MKQAKDNHHRLSLSINGERRKIECPPEERLLDTLRYRVGLTGTKEGCGEGECGACTVILDGLPVNSCLVPTIQARGSELRTIESVDADEVEVLHRTGATQCGACTPGVVLSILWIKENRHLVETHSVRELMAGNLCRCTGYDGIIEGLEEILSRSREVES